MPEIMLKVSDEEYALLDRLAKNSGKTVTEVVYQTLFEGHRACCVATGEVFVQKHTKTLKLFNTTLKGLEITCTLCKLTLGEIEEQNLP